MLLNFLYNMQVKLYHFWKHEYETLTYKFIKHEKAQYYQLV